jgi:hypothetical protein
MPRRTRKSSEPVAAPSDGQGLEAAPVEQPDATSDPATNDQPEPAGAEPDGAEPAGSG